MHDSHDALAHAAVDIPPPGSPRTTKPSLQQQRLWLASQMGTRLQYIYTFAVRLSGVLDTDALRTAFASAVSRHEALRTALIPDVDGVPQQVVQTPYAPLGQACPVLGEEELEDAARSFICEGFDLERGQPLRAALFRLSSEDHALVVALHHAATDGWSNGLLFTEIAEFYSARRAGRAPRVAESRTQYGDYAERQRAWLNTPSAQRDLDHWSTALARHPYVLNLPVDRLRTGPQNFVGDRVGFTITADVARAVSRLAHNELGSPFMVLLTAFSVLLSRWISQRDVIVGVPSANRSDPEFESTVGFFVNVLPIPCSIDEHSTFRDAVGALRRTAIAAYDHESTPFDRIVEAIAPQRSPTHNTLVQVVFGYRPQQLLPLDGLSVAEFDVSPDVVNYDLSFEYTEDNGTDGFLFEVAYATDIIDRSTIEHLVARYTWLLEEVTANPDRLLREVPAATPDERQLVAGWGQGSRPDESWTPIHQAVRIWAQRDPDGDAVLCGSEQLTFSQLNRRADQIAALLQDLGVSVEHAVGVCMSRSVDLPAAIIGVLRAGASYLPLDSSQPAARLAGILRDSGADIVLVDSATAAGAAQWAKQVVDIADIREQRGNGRLATIDQAQVHPDQIAYTIFTSGSTGKPKGVQVTHRALANLLVALEHLGAAGPGRDRVAWNADPTFDASVQQWVRLARGDTVVLLSDVQRRDPHELTAVVRGHRITHIDFTPTHLELFADHLARDGTGPLTFLVGGEPVPPDLWRRMGYWTDLGVARAINLFGLTETTVDAVATQIGGGSPHIGRPLHGGRAVVVDNHMRPVPPGVIGELWLGGTGIARGYLHAAATASRFVADPFTGDGSRLYRTGDLARWRPEGVLEHMGRRDRQVKVRGYRIELAEVEAGLRDIDGIDAALVVVADLPGGRGLVGYFVVGKESDKHLDVRAETARRLPWYMVPEHVIEVDQLPVTTSGKIDISIVRPVTAARRTTAPSNPIEELVAGLWQELLGIDEVDVNDNFFALGGHSLQAARFVARLRSRILLSLSVTVVFAHPTVRALSGHVESMMRTLLNQEKESS